MEATLRVATGFVKSAAGECGLSFGATGGHQRQLAPLEARFGDLHRHAALAVRLFHAHDAADAVEMEDAAIGGSRRVRELDAEADRLPRGKLLVDDEIHAARADVARHAGAAVLEAHRDFGVHAVVLPRLSGHGSDSSLSAARYAINTEKE